MTQSSRSLRNEKLIIRRIVESFRTRSFSVFAAELIIVIVGVFIGIQVSNWNDARQDRTRANSYLERIRADLESDLANYQDRVKLWQEVSAYGRLGLTYANDGSLGEVEEWDLLLAYFQASQLAEFHTTRSTYDELKSGGELGLIRDLELRNILAQYYTNADNPVLSERPAYREHIRGLIPIDVQDYIWEKCYSVDSYSQIFLDCEAPIARGEAARLIGVISNDAQVMSELRYWMSTMRVALIMGESRTELAEQIDSIVNEIIDDRRSLENE
jgi:hypothetical protein